MGDLRLTTSHDAARRDRRPTFATDARALIVKMPDHQELDQSRQPAFPSAAEYFRPEKRSNLALRPVGQPGSQSLDEGFDQKVPKVVPKSMSRCLLVCMSFDTLNTR